MSVGNKFKVGDRVRFKRILIDEIVDIDEILVEDVQGRLIFVSSDGSNCLISLGKEKINIDCARLTEATREHDGRIMENFWDGYYRCLIT